jgi:hypothetical protein
MNSWSLTLLRWSYVAFIVYASAQTFADVHAAHGSHGWPIAVLALVEIAAALALLLAPLEFAACVVLLAVYGIAAVLTVADGEVPLRFIFYGATALVLGRSSVTPGLTSAARAE